MICVRLLFSGFFDNPDSRNRRIYSADCKKFPVLLILLWFFEGRCHKLFLFITIKNVPRHPSPTPLAPFNTRPLEHVRTPTIKDCLGNDFEILDGSESRPGPNSEQIRKIGPAWAQEIRQSLGTPWVVLSSIW